MATQIIEGDGAKAFGQKEKWAMLGPFLRRYGSEALAYATLQEGMNYYVDQDGYIAYTTVYHPVFARKKLRIALSDPICAPDRYAAIVSGFLKQHPRAAFGVISQQC